MRLDAWLSKLPYSLLISSLSLAVAAPTVSSTELTVLTPANFKETISKGVWFIEHFSPYCGHCRRFAPTWTQLVEETEKKEDPGIHLAQVNCAVDGDLCRENKVDGYPQLNLYQDGQFVEVFKQARELDLLRNYINEHARPSHKPKPPVNSDQALLSHEVYNPDGVVVPLDESSFDKVIKKGHTFVKFFAPWCGHCKKLAPIWTQLALQMKGKLNVVEVDCEAHGALCRREGVTGYPMLFYYGDNGHGKTEYTGGRKLDQLKNFAEKVSGPAVQELLPENLDKVVTANPVVYLLLHPATDTTSLPTTIEASHVLFGSLSIHVSTSPSLYSHFNVDPSKAVILALKDHDLSTPAAWYTLDHSSTEDLAQWLLRNRLPTYQELDSDSFQEVMNAKHKPLVVIVAAPKSQLSEVSTHVKDIAKQWKDKKAAGDVVFTWMDGDKWSSWLKSMYGVSTSAGPQVVVADHQRLVYYDVDQFGEKLKLSPASIFSAIQGAQSGTIAYKNSENIAERFARVINNQLVSIEGAVSAHPWRVTFFVVAVLAAFGFFIRRLLRDESAYADELAHKARLD